MHTEALFKGPTLFRIFTRKYHWQQNDLKSIFPKKNWVFWREIITRTINNLKYICENQHLPGKFFTKKLIFFYVSLLAGNFTVEKKVCTFELCLALIKKYSKSFGGKNLASSTRFFSHRKPRIYFVLILDSVQIRKNFFPFGNPPYAKKRKREPIFWLVTRPFK